MGKPVKRKTLPHHDHFSEYTEDEIAKIKAYVCVKHECPYLRGLSKSGNNSKAIAPANRCCNYSLLTGHSRGCMPDECTHYKDKNVKKRLSPISGEYI